MGKFFLYRFFQLIPTLWGIGTLVFLLLHFVPGDPIDALLGESALPASREALRKKLHLDLPLGKQYILFWQGVFHADFGDSIALRKPVIDLIKERVPATASLALVAILCACLIAFPAGAFAAWKKNKWPDHSIMLFSLLGVSLPSFWLAPLLMLFFSVHLGWLPVSERSGWESYILPALTLGLALSAVLARIIRAGLVDTLSQDYITTARSKGLSEFRVVGKHALKNALIPVITILGLQMGGLLSGAVITETIFDWPGIGELLYRAIQSRDFPLVQGCVLVIAAIFVLVNTLADFAYTWANPKLELKA